MEICIRRNKRRNIYWKVFIVLVCWITFDLILHFYGFLPSVSWPSWYCLLFKLHVLLSNFHWSSSNGWAGSAHWKDFLISTWRVDNSHSENPTVVHNKPFLYWFNFLWLYCSIFTYWGIRFQTKFFLLIFHFENSIIFSVRSPLSLKKNLKEVDIWKEK